MDPSPRLARIRIYPLKSLDAMDLETAIIGSGGGLLHDREFGLFDALGNPLIGKTTAHVHGLHGRVDFAAKTVAFRRREEMDWHVYDFETQIDRANAYLSEYFGFPVFLRRDTHSRFLDKPDWSGATLVSTATLQAVAAWYPGMDTLEIRDRFRATLEIEGVPPFWEDGLFGPEGSALAYRIGEVTLWGIGPRSRCVVPTRHPETAKVYPGFAPSFSKSRFANLPVNSGLRPYSNHYYLTVDSYFPDSEIGKTLRVGDRLERVGTLLPAPPQRGF